MCNFLTNTHIQACTHTVEKKIAEVNSVQLTCVSASGNSTGRSLGFGAATQYGVSLLTHFLSKCVCVLFCKICSYQSLQRFVFCDCLHWFHMWCRGPGGRAFPCHQLFCQQRNYTHKELQQVQAMGLKQFPIKRIVKNMFFTCDWIILNESLRAKIKDLL